MGELKHVVCRFHGGDMDGIFDSRVDLQFGHLSREHMAIMYGGCNLGGMVGGMSNHAIQLMLDGIHPTELQGRSQYYVCKERVETDHLIEVDFASVVVKEIDGKHYVFGTYKGKDFRGMLKTD